MSQEKTARRWTIQFPNGIETTLVESTPEEAAEAAARFQKKLHDVRAKERILKLAMLGLTLPIAVLLAWLIGFFIGLAVAGAF